LIDKEQIAIMIKDIERYLSDLEGLAISSKQDLEEKEKYYAVSMLVFSILNRTIDIGNEIIGGSNISLPGSYKDTFEALFENKVISSATFNQMVWLMKYRNIIAHEYYRLSTEEIYSLKKRISNVIGFISEIKKFIQKR